MSDFIKVWDSKKGKYIEVAKNKISSMEEEGIWFWKTTKIHMDSGKEIETTDSSDSIKRRIKVHFKRIFFMSFLHK